MSNRDYLIDKRIKFSPTNESVHLADRPDISVALTPACSRLLQYMIFNKGTVLTRDNIFNELWVQYGSTPSNSSLNTYISLIRKSFINLGEERELIITIPKTGFLFNPDIEVEVLFLDPINLKDNLSDGLIHHLDDDTEFIQYAEGENHEKSLDLTSEWNGKQKNKNSNPTHKIPRWLLSGTITTGTLIFILIIYFVFWVCKINEQKYIHPIKIGKINNCNVLFLPLNGETASSLQSKDIISITNKSGFNCRDSGIFYIFADKRYPESQKGKVFVSYCESNDKFLKSCMDFIGINVKSP